MAFTSASKAGTDSQHSELFVMSLTNMAKEMNFDATIRQIYYSARLGTDKYKEFATEYADSLKKKMETIRENTITQYNNDIKQETSHFKSSTTEHKTKKFTAKEVEENSLQYFKMNYDLMMKKHEQEFPSGEQAVNKFVENFKSVGSRTKLT